MAKEEIYELLYILSPELDDAQVEQVHQRLMETLAAGGGKIRRESKWGKRRLAYEVNKFREGYYIFVEFDGTGRAVKEINDFVRLEGNILRHLVTGVPKAKLDEENRRAELAKKKAEEAQKQAEARAAQEAEKAAQEAAESEAAPAPVAEVEPDAKEDNPDASDADSESPPVLSGEDAEASPSQADVEQPRESSDSKGD